MALDPTHLMMTNTITKTEMQKGSNEMVTRASMYTCEICEDMLDARHCMFKNPRPPPLAVWLALKNPRKVSGQVYSKPRKNAIDCNMLRAVNRMYMGTFLPDL